MHSLSPEITWKLQERSLGKLRASERDIGMVKALIHNRGNKSRCLFRMCSAMIAAICGFAICFHRKASLSFLQNHAEIFEISVIFKAEQFLVRVCVGCHVGKCNMHMYLHTLECLFIADLKTGCWFPMYVCMQLQV